VALREVSARIADQAAALTPASIRSLDAIHLASALELGPELAAFVTYDARLAEAAAAAGLPVVAPSPV
jgi:predicted nucleic acid-binding protein